ncbi:trehalose-phosphatase [Allostreptomyces psammosilenae]|uniref:Trehalose 6-phosphate phosphatase n=1 Tax=Allostreptomyces psammosilenae TaxID=1892865 RepID=A0A853A0H7_9ACTN|nr:trehalose-phosphatase [Allostreptomyces psammosilenae]NYI07627.1 trehalose 6-phosphate phosphatase [Allostreptomyces psammosilenae]
MGTPEPTTEAGRRGWAAIQSDPTRAVVALDFDGTLAPIVPDPDQARAHPAAVPVLARLAPLVDSVVVVTGRPAASAVRHGGFTDVPGLDGLVVLGHYGAERWDAATGRLTAPEPPPGVETVRRELPALLRSLDDGTAFSTTAGVTVEDKERSLAVHTRRSPDPAGAQAALARPLEDLAERCGLVVEPGRFVLELRPPGVDKGAALRGYLAERGAAAVLYAGDDLGDLAAYAAVEELRGSVGGPAGVLVCSAAGEGAVAELAARADIEVDGPAGVVALLDDLAKILG